MSLSIPARCLRSRHRVKMWSRSRVWRTGEGLHPIQRAFLEEDAGQCGYCTPGFVMSAYALLRRNPSPSEGQIREALQGNLCRCNAYGRIIRGVMAAADAMKEQAD